MTLQANSCRRVHWATKLGLTRLSIALPLRAVSSNGGVVPKLSALLVRRYPTIYTERFEDGSVIQRFESGEERARNQFQVRHCSMFEWMLTCL